MSDIKVPFSDNLDKTEHNMFAKLQTLSGKERQKHLELMRSIGLIAPKDDGFFGELADRTAGSFVGGMRGIGNTVKKLTGSDSIYNYFNEGLLRNQQWNAPEEQTIGGYLGGAIGSAVGSTATALGASAVGTVIGGPKVGAALGAAAIFSQTFGDNVERNREAGYSPDKAYGMAFLESSLDSAIEMLPGGIVGKPLKSAANINRIMNISRAGKRELLNKVGQKVAAAVGQKEAQSLLARWGKAAAVGGAGESMEEGLQYFNSYINQVLGGDENANFSINELADAMAQGFIGGFALGGFRAGENRNATGEVAAPEQLNETQMFDQLARDVGDYLGIKVRFMDKTAEGTDLAEENNGMFDKKQSDTLFLNRTSYNENPAFTLGHELKHFIDFNRPDLGKAFDELLKDNSTELGLEYLEKVNEKDMREYAGDIFGQIFAKPDTWGKVATKLNEKTPGMGEQFLQLLVDFVKLIKQKLKTYTAAPEAQAMLKEYDKVEAQAVNMLAELRKNKLTAPEVTEEVKQESVSPAPESIAPQAAEVQKESQIVEDKEESVVKENLTTEAVAAARTEGELYFSRKRRENIAPQAAEVQKESQIVEDKEESVVKENLTTEAVAATPKENLEVAETPQENKKNEEEFPDRTEEVGGGFEDFYANLTSTVDAYVNKAVRMFGNTYGNSIETDYRAAIDNALTKAYERFDPSYGVQLNTYVSNAIKNAIHTVNRSKKAEFAKQGGSISLDQTNEQGDKLEDAIAAEEPEARNEDLLGDYNKWKEKLDPHDRRILELSEQGLPPSKIATARGVGMTTDEVYAKLRELAVVARTEGELYFSKKRRENIEDVNNNFNNDLERQINGTLPSGYIYQLGRPGDILLSTGVPDLPIELSSVRLSEKSKQENHPFDIADLKDLPNALQNPVAVFAYGDPQKAQNIIVEIQSESKNFLVGLLMPSKDNKLSVNFIKGLFPKNTSSWIRWIQQGKSLYLNKEKVQTLIAQQRTNLADVSNLDLHSVDNIIKNFKNANDDLQFSRKRIYTGSAANYDKPSLQYIGTGEGAQAFGWGLYGSESEDVARWYAKKDAVRKSENTFEARTIRHKVQDFITGKTIPSDESKRKIFAQSLQDYVTRTLKKEIDELEFLAENAIDPRNKSSYENNLAKTQKILDSLTEFDLMEFAENRNRHLYNQTFWPDKDEVLIDWDENIDVELFSLIDAQLTKEGVFIAGDWGQAHEDLQRIAELYSEGKATAEELDSAVEKAEKLHALDVIGRETSGKNVYEALVDLLGSPKAASEFLYRAGIDGITYIGDSSGVRNYVAFSDKDIQVDEHIQFSKKRRHQQINPVIVDGVVRDEYADLLGNKEYTPEKIAEWQAQALEWIEKAGSVAQAVKKLLSDQAPSNSAVAEIARRMLINSNEFFDKVSNQDRKAFYKMEIDARSQWGRLGRSMQLNALLLKDVMAVQALLEKLGKTIPDAERNKLRDSIKKALGLDIDNLPKDIVNDKAKLDAVLREYLAHKASFGDKLYEYWINGILSGPSAHVANFFGNTANAVYELGIKRFTEALVNTAAGRKDGATFGEFRQIVKAFNWQNALKAARMSFNLETLDLEGKFMEGNTVAIGGKAGRFIRTPGRLLKAADALAKALIEPAETAAYAYRMGVMKGLSGSELQNYIQKQLTDKESNAYKWGRERSRELTFQEEPSEYIKRLMVLRESGGATGIVLKLLLPFIKTPANILKQGVRKSVLGSFNLAFETGKLALGKRNFDSEYISRVAEQLIAWGAFMALAGLDDDDDIPIITGSSPDYGSAEYGFKANKVPAYSIRIGDIWYSYQRIEPLATGLAAIADTLGAMRDMRNGKDATAVMKKLVKNAGQTFAEKSYLDSIGEIVKTVQDPERNLMQPATNTLSSALPAFVRQIRQAFREEVDDNKNRSYGADWWREQMFIVTNRAGVTTAVPKIDYFGRPVKKDSWGNLFLSPVGRILPIKRVRGDDSMDQAEQLVWNYNMRNPNAEWYPTIPQPRFTKDGKKYYFDGEDYTDYAIESGKLAHRQINNAIRAGRLNVSRPDEDDIKLIKKIFSRARKETRMQMMRENRAKHLEK